MRIGCYSTARVSRGRVERVERHVARLLRDAARLGLEAPSRPAVETALLAAAAEAFPADDGIVRIEWSREEREDVRPPNPAPASRFELLTTPRSLGPDRKHWRARVADTVHPGPAGRHGAKALGVAAIDHARREMRAALVDEVLLFDATGALVEGAHSNCLWVDSQGRLSTPASSLGAVDGLGLRVLREGSLEIREGRLDRTEVASVREILGVNAVRGVVPIVELDGAPIADGGVGPWARRLRRWFFRDDPD